MRHCPSPNFGPRRDGLLPTMIVIHYTAMQNAQAAIDRLCDPAAEVSAHYVIDCTGGLVQLVPEDQRAWHAGVGEWRGQSDINSRSIGIELDNRGDHPFPEPQMLALESLLRGILSRWVISIGNIIGHSDMAPGRKFDPGVRFDWARLARQGLARQAGICDDPFNPTPAQFRARARSVGFTAEVDDETLLSAVRLRFRPHAQGALCPDDFASLGHGGLVS